MPDRLRQDIQELLGEVRACLEDQTRLGIHEWPQAENGFNGEAQRLPGESQVVGEVETLEGLHQQVLACEKCPLSNRRKRLTGYGPSQPRLIVAVPSPTRVDLDHGQLLAGEAGQLFEAILFACGLQRDQVYVTSLLKCAPPERALDPGEVAQCLEHLKQEMTLLGPAPTLIMGMEAGAWLWPDLSSDGRGVWHRWNNRQLRLTHHPASLVKQSELKADVWEDIKGLLSPA